MGVTARVSATEAWNIALATVPDGYRPAQQVSLIAVITTQYWEAVGVGAANVTSDGKLRIEYKVGFAPYQALIFGCYPVR